MEWPARLPPVGGGGVSVCIPGCHRVVELPDHSRVIKLSRSHKR